MSTLALDSNARARSVRTTRDELIVELQDGRTLTVPLTWFPRLLHATERQRNRWELLGDGEGIHWPDLDEDLSVAGLLRGSPAAQAARVQEPPPTYKTRRRSRSRSSRRR